VVHKKHDMSNIVHLELSAQYSGVLGIFWFRIFQKHQIYPKGRPCHTVRTFDGRKDGRLTGPPYWQTTKWPCHTVRTFDGRKDGRLTGPPYWQTTKWPPSG